MHGRDEDDPKVNPIALVELIHDFVLVYENILRWVDPMPAKVQFTVGLRNVLFGDGKALYLPPGRVDGLSWQAPAEYETPRPTLSDWDQRIEADVSPTPPHLGVGTVAFLLVERVYRFFGHPVEHIPYTNEARNEIDVGTFPEPRWVPA
jgi:hypothetical protein